MMSAAGFTVATLGFVLHEAVEMACSTPARFMGLQAKDGSIAVDNRSGFVLLDNVLEIQSVWQGGISVQD